MVNTLTLSHIGDILEDLLTEVDQEWIDDHVRIYLEDSSKTITLEIWDANDQDYELIKASTKQI